MTNLKCDCGKFKAELQNFPKNSPDRCICYCDDCQTYLHSIGRSELLDSHGGTEIIPVYPADFKIRQRKEFLACVQLSPEGLFRWYTSCCNTPLGNQVPKFPYLGMLNRMFTFDDPSYLDQVAGPIKSRIHRRFAKGTPPAGTSMKTSFKDLRLIFPFVLRGFLGGKAKDSPLFAKDGVTPIASPRVLIPTERSGYAKPLSNS